MGSSQTARGYADGGACLPARSWPSWRPAPRSSRARRPGRSRAPKATAGGRRSRATPRRSCCLPETTARSTTRPPSPTGRVRRGSARQERQRQRLRQSFERLRRVGQRPRQLTRRALLAAPSGRAASAAGGSAAAAASGSKQRLRQQRLRSGLGSVGPATQRASASGRGRSPDATHATRAATAKPERRQEDLIAYKVTVTVNWGPSNGTGAVTLSTLRLGRQPEDDGTSARMIRPARVPPDLPCWKCWWR